MNRTNTTSENGTLPRPFLWFGGGVALTCIVYWPSLAPLWQQWMIFDQSLGHGLALFLVICGWLWSCRTRFEALAAAPSMFGAVAVAMPVAAWLLASLGDIELLEQLALIGVFGGLAVLMAGWRAAMVLLPPLSMLIFCVPILDEFNQQLVDLSAVVVGNALELTPITSFMIGNTVLLPSGSLVIAGGCSGLRYLVIGLAIANLASSMNALTWWSQLIANALTIVLMLAVNWFRIIMITAAAYVTEMQSPLVRDHESFGWVVFAFALIPLLLYVRNAPYKSETA